MYISPARTLHMMFISENGHFNIMSFVFTWFEQLFILHSFDHYCLFLGLDLSDYAESYVKAFGAGSPCDIPKTVRPVKGPWQYGGMKRY